MATSIFMTLKTSNMSFRAYLPILCYKCYQMILTFQKTSNIGFAIRIGSLMHIMHIL